VQRIDPAELRRLFEEGAYLDRAAAGELLTRVRRSGHPSPASSGQPHCTKSQIIEYCDRSGQRLAIAHQYLRPDGSIGASGRPDPKALLIDGVLYTVLGHQEPGRGPVEGRLGEPGSA